MAVWITSSYSSAGKGFWQ